MTRFGFVGVGAMLVHWTAVATMVPLGLVPLVANIIAFLIAFPVSYYGHSYWTFKSNSFSRHRALSRFFLVASGSFLLNEGMYFLLLRYTAQDYRISLFIVLLSVAVVTFVISKKWAFDNS